MCLKYYILIGFRNGVIRLYLSNIKYSKIIKHKQCYFYLLTKTADFKHVLEYKSFLCLVICLETG